MTVIRMKVLPNSQLELSVIINEETPIVHRELQMLRKLGFIVKLVDA